MQAVLARWRLREAVRYRAVEVESRRGKGSHQRSKHMHGAGGIRSRVCTNQRQKLPWRRILHVSNNTCRAYGWSPKKTNGALSKPTAIGSNQEHYSPKNITCLQSVEYRQQGRRYKHSMPPA